MTDFPPPALPPDTSWRRDCLWLAVAFALLFGIKLGTHPLVNPDEGRYAEIPREMVVTGDWVTPRLDGVKYFEKPPLMYWSVAGCYVIFGSSEWSMRAMPALFAIAGVLLTYAAGRRIYGRTAGLAAAVILGTSLIYYALARVLILDMALAVLMSATLFCFILGVREPARPGIGAASSGNRRRWLFYGLYASAALATLTKGLIGFLLTGLVMFLWLLVFNQWKRLRPLYLPTGVVVFLAIAAPWHLLAAQRNPDWASFYFVHEHWERFTTTAHMRSEPWWFFIPWVVVGLFPWIGFLDSAVRHALRGGWKARADNADAWFLALWAAVVFLFFSKSQSKLIPYILPIFPPLAVLIGAWLADAVTAGVARLRFGLRVFSFGCGLIGIALLAAVLKPGTLIRDPALALALQPHAFAAAAVLILGGIFTPWFARNRGVGTAMRGIAVTIAAFYVVLAWASPHFLQTRSTKPLTQIFVAEARPDDRVFHYREFLHDFVFYTRRPVEVVDFEGELMHGLRAEPQLNRLVAEAEFRRVWAGAGRVFVVVRRNEKAQFESGAGTASYHLLGETPHGKPRYFLYSNRPGRNL